MVIYMYPGQDLNNPWGQFIFKDINVLFICPFPDRDRGGVVVERRTPNREVLGPIPTGVTVLCP